MNPTIIDKQYAPLYKQLFVPLCSNLMALGLKKYWSILKNKYILILLLFAIWMIFIDSNSWFTHHELNQEIDELEDNKEYYKKEITKDQKGIKNLKNPAGLEKFARETYFMKKEEEEIFIIEYQDSLSTSEN